MTKQRGEITRIRPEHDERAVTRHLDGARYQRVHERPTIDAHELLGRTEATGAAGGEHDGIQGGAIVEGSAHPGSLKGRPRASCTNAWISLTMASAMDSGARPPIARPTGARNRGRNRAATSP